MQSLLTPEGAAVIFGASCVLFGILLVLDSKQKLDEVEDYRFMQRVYGWILIGIPALFVLGGIYSKYSGKSPLSPDKSSDTNPFAAGYYPGSTADLRVKARIENLSLFEYIMYQLGLRKLKKSDLSPGDMYY
jgi:hypothetical protein